MQWKAIEGYAGLYEVSDEGLVRSLPRCGTVNTARHISPVMDKDGYQAVTLRNKGRHTFKLHRLVAKAFVPNPNNKPQVNHIDGNKRNNKASNLEWVTNSENILHAKQLGLQMECPNRKQVLQISNSGKVLASYPSLRAAEQATGIGWTGISAVTRGKRNTAGGYRWEVI